jgi:hypothetical protein
MKLATVAWYTVATAGVLGFLWLIGTPFQLVLDEIAGKRGRGTVRDRGSAVPTPLFGLFAITIGSWYVLESGRTVSSLPFVLAAVAVLVSALIMVVRSHGRGARLRNRQRRNRTPQLPTVAAVFALNMVMSLFTLGTVYANGRQTVLSLGNIDIASYAIHAQALLHGGFRQHGNYAGINLGANQKILGYGADTILASVASLLRTDVLHVLGITMLAATFLGVYGLVRLLSERFGVSLPLAILAAQSAYGVFFVAYLQGQYFLSDLLAMALLPAFLTLLIDVVESDSGRKWLSAVLSIGALAATGIALYPQMAVLTAAMFLPAAAFGGRISGLIRRLWHGGVGLVCGIAVGAAIAPGLTRIGWHLSVNLTRLKVGWSLHRLLVTDVLGFQTSAALHHSWASWVLSGAILLVVALAGAWLWYRQAFRELISFAFVALATILASYLVVFWYEGVSYQQWKWITYLTPLFVALLLAQVLSALSLVKTDVVNGPSVARAAGVVYLLTVTALAAPASFPLAASPAAYDSVSVDAATIASNPQLKALRSVNVDVNPGWDTMWLAYFLRNKEVYLVSLSFFAPMVKPKAEWTIEPIDGPPKPGDAIRLNAMYQLVRNTGA